MIKMFRILPLCFALLFAGLVSAQRTPSEFKRFIGQKTVHVQAQLKIKGYEPIVQGRRTANQFYNRKSNRCVSLRTAGDKVAAIYDTPGQNCARHGNDNPRPTPKPQPKPGPGQPAYLRHQDLVGKTATEAYVLLRKRRFSETKEVKGGGNTYKLWMNGKGECLKTTSRDGKISSVKASSNCR